MNDAPFLHKDPPPAVARGLSTLIVILFVTALVVAATVRVSETVTAPFTLIPVRGADPVRAPRKGSVTKAAAIVGQPVTKGSLLYEINSPEFADRFSERETLDSTVIGVMQSLSNARARRASENRAAEEEARGLTARVASLDRTVALKKEQLALMTEQLDRFRKLADQGLASTNERSDIEIKRSQVTLELENLQAESAAAKSALQKLRNTEAGRQSAFREEERALAEKMEHSRIRVSALNGESSGPRAADIAVNAPCDGAVTSVKVRNAGAVVLEGDVLADVACQGETLQAELEAPQVGLSRIQAGQPVRLLLDAFPYQRYGARGGTVRWASPSGLGSSAAQTFPVLVDLEAQSVDVGGATRPLVVGMRGTARVVVGRRTLIEYAFEPFRELRENLR